MAKKLEKTGLVDDLVALLEKDSIGFELFTYGVTGLGLLTALYRIRPFAKFSNPTKIPAHFLEKQTLLKGKAVRIEPGKIPVILVDHKPLLPLPRLGEARYLPVKIAGVDVNTHGISWLSTIVQGNNVEFVPVRKTSDFVDCRVTMAQGAGKEPLQIGKELVKLGFGTVGELPTSPEDKVLQHYKKTLNSAESWAKFKRNGQWHFIIPPSLTWKIKNLLAEKLSFRT